MYKRCVITCTEFFFFLKWRTVIPSTRETRSVVSYLFKTPLRRKDSLPSRTHARTLSFLRGVPDKKHVLSRKTGRHGSSCTRTRLVTRVTCLCARTSRDGVHGACVAHTGVRNFRPTYTRVIYYVARREHMSHLHIA